MRDRQERFESVMRRIGSMPGAVANNVIDLEDRVRELEDEMIRVSMALTDKAKRTQR